VTSTNRRTLLGATAALVTIAATRDRSSAQDTATPAATPTAVDPMLPGDPATLGAPAVPQATTSLAADALSIAAATAPYAEYGTDAAPGVFPREIRHAMGVTTLEQAPVRVVVLDTGELDAMVQVGLIPVGTAEYSNAGLPTYIDQAVEGITVIGLTAEPDLEAIAGLAPDLILSSKLRNETIYDDLSRIAPTIFAESPGVTWKQNFKLYVQSVGRETEGAAVVARYVERARALNAGLPESRPISTVVNIRADQVRVYQRASFSGVLLTDHGFPRDAPSNVDDFAAYPSVEELGAYITADLVILATATPTDNPFADGILAGDVWSLLPAVQFGTVLTVDATAWIGGIGYGAAFLVQDDLATQFGITLG